MFLSNAQLIKALSVHLTNVGELPNIFSLLKVASNKSILHLVDEN
ncbi:hypothetical protein [Malacoplasma iowae]|nr:hypothetical protein [Malacoplasma iowae]WPL36376.1 hypothetical protein QX179_02985 [Malacoplasma iowae]WPL37460.1 hypothetical protein QX182_03050 [Malacoplasma iowae]WPL40989.1 hypothetical protein QX184_00065 [Malacoplasma iowae]